MKYDYLKHMPVKSRPKMLSAWEKSYFTDGKHITCLVLASAPGVVSAIWNAALSRWIWAMFGLILTEALVLVGFTTICSGMASSNWGTYFRASEPMRYWTDVVIIAGFYAFAMTGMWIGK
jgi:hypothetical protein